jgi:hypothetical protein
MRIDRGAPIAARHARNCTGGELILPSLPARRMKARGSVTKGAHAAYFVARAEGCELISHGAASGLRVA